jgi:hypothetical protein
MMTMITTPIPSEDPFNALSIRGSFKGAAFTFETSAPEILAALAKYDSSDVAIEALLKIGACAVLATASDFDVQAVRKEIDRAVEQTSNALATLNGQLDKTIGDDGPLAATLDKLTTSLSESLRQSFAAQANGEDPASLIARLQVTVKQISDAAVQIRKEIAEEVRTTAEKQSEVVSRTLREMRDLDPNSGLGGAVTRIERELGEIKVVMGAAQAAATERRRGTAKGFDFEDLLEAELAPIAATHGDQIERTSTQSGRVISHKRASLRGDFVCTTPATLAIVVEAKDYEGTQLRAR